MKLKANVTLAGLHLLMRPALKAAEDLWIAHGRPEGVTVTCARGGIHSAGSWHYYGLALDFRTRYFEDDIKKQVYHDLKNALPLYDVIEHDTHIHVEPSDNLADKHGLLI